MLEEWKDIPDWEGLYKVSNLGNVWSCRFNKPKLGSLNNLGYLRVQLCDGATRKKYSVHRLVAELFCDGWFMGAVVNHKDHNKQNNRADNLEWVTPSENSKHAYLNGLQTGAFTAKKYTIELENGCKIHCQSISDAKKISGMCKTSLFNYMKSGRVIRKKGFSIYPCASND